MEWWMVCVLLIFRAIHLIQLALAVPDASARIVHPALAAVVLALIFVESAWLTRRLFRVRGYGGIRTAGVEVTAAVVVLLAFAVLLPAGNRANLATPLVDLATEQITGVAIGSSVDVPLSWLAGGTIAVTASYGTLIALGQPAALGTPAALIGITGIVALAILIRIGAVRLLAIAGQLDQLSRRQHEQEQRDELAVELHNHLGDSLTAFQYLDPADQAEVERVRRSVQTAAGRLNAYISTGRFHEELSFGDVLKEQVRLARADGLALQFVVRPHSLLDAPPALAGDQLDVMERALRAVLINVRRNAGVRDALLHVMTRTTPDGDTMVELLVSDQGRGFAAGVLAHGLGGRSLARHQAALRRAGGDLVIESVPGSTEVTITLPYDPVLVGPGTP
jgi:signal transduction histidine kinase